MADEVRFSPWVNWRDRSDIEGKNFPGVYFISMSRKTPSGDPVNDRSIIYIGETTGQTLGKRLAQFHSSAFRGAPGHSGGKTFREKMGTSTPEKHLWISSYPVQRGEIYTSAYIKHVERKLIWEFECKYGGLPLCNSA